MGPGESIGRRVVGHRLVQIDGQPVSHQQAIVRNLAAVGLNVVTFGVVFLVDLIRVLANQDRVCDRLLGTTVVEAPRQGPVIPSADIRRSLV